MKRTLKTLLLLVGVSLTGCVSYSQHDLPVVQNWPLPNKEAAAKPSAYIRFTTLHTMNGQQTPGGTNPAAWEKVFVDNVKQSERFQSVTTDKTESDVYVYATLRNQETGSFASAILTGATLYVIPTTFDNKLVLETVYKDRDGKTLGRVEKSETVTTWMQLLLVFALPFNQSPDGIIQHLTQSSLEEAVKQKLI
ncbi:hypothetical protein [Pseudomonas sp. NPDC088444]|uniref:hypothetical protein n=1 Tax=Pseudomonas sp. NPDC088444 TaxID=3364456 RepID=UPI0038510198